MNKTIVFLHPHFLKPAGASKVVLEQTSRLISEGKKCIVVTTRVNPDVTKPYPKVKIIELSNLTTGNLLFWFTFPIFFYKLNKTLHNIDSDIIYCHSLAIYWGYFYKKINRNIKLIYYLHDLGLPYTDLKIEIKSLKYFQKIFLSIISPLLKTLNKNIFSAADFIIANSKTSAKYLLKTYYRKADEIVFPGVDINVFKSNGIKKDYVFTVGRLEKSKSIDKIIKGFSLFIQNNPGTKIKLYIIGEGVEKNNLLHIVDDEMIKDKVFFLGRKNSKEVSEIASQALLGIFLGSYETFGIAATESLACGTPVIGINTGGISEIVGEKSAGMLVDGTPKSVCDALTKMLNPKFKLEKISNNAANYASKNLSLNKQISKLNSFFNNI